MESERLDVVAELAEGCRCAGPGQAGTDHDYVELPLVRRVDQIDGEPMIVPFVFEWSGGHLGVECHQSKTPVSTSNGKLRLPRTINEVIPTAIEVRIEAIRGLFEPRLWNMLHMPWST